MNYETLKDEAAWAKAQWSGVELGDVRRTARAIKVGAKLAALAAESLPQQQGSWGDVKAAYRLLNEGDVRFEALSQGHRAGSLEAAKKQAGVVLFIQDGSELNYSRHKATRGLGYIGNGKGQGFQLHSCLAVNATSEAAIGLVKGVASPMELKRDKVRNIKSMKTSIIKMNEGVFGTDLSSERSHASSPRFRPMHT